MLLGKAKGKNRTRKNLKLENKHFITHGASIITLVNYEPVRGEAETASGLKPGKLTLKKVSISVCVALS